MILKNMFILIFNFYKKYHGFVNKTRSIKENLQVLQ